MRTEIRICGFGGQGIILAGIILGKSASLFDGKEAVQTQSYGPEARGGASKCPKSSGWASRLETQRRANIIQVQKHSAGRILSSLGRTILSSIQAHTHYER